jgi:hypothetical protein
MVGGWKDLARPRQLLVGTAMLVLGACAAGEPPAGAITEAELAVQRATEAQAGQYAPVELSRAQNRLTDAKIASEDERYEEARRLAEQAESDAELARARASAAASEEQSEEIRSTTDEVREELEPASGARATVPTVISPSPIR